MVEPIENAASVAALSVFSLPLRVALKSLPTKRPSSVLHANVIKISEQLVPGQPIDIYYPLADQNDVLDG
jgi:hypothetical protein